MQEDNEDVREWAALPGQVLQHVFQDDPTTSLRRPARAVCSPWRAAINAHVQQAYCDVGDVPLLRSFTGLRSVIVDEVDLLGRFMRQRQQRYWAIPKQQQPQVPQPFIPSDPLPPPAPPEDNPSSSSNSRQEASSSQRSRSLARMPLAQHLADLGRLEIFGPPKLDVSPLVQLPGLQDVTLRCIHLVTRLPLHTVHLVHVTSLTLQQMHTFGQQRVNALPVALVPMRKLRRLALIGIRQQSVVELLESMDLGVYNHVAGLWQGVEVAAAGRGGPGSTSDGQQQQQQQQQEAPDGPPTCSTGYSIAEAELTGKLMEMALGPKAASSSSSRGSGSGRQRGLRTGSSSSGGGGSTGGFPTGGSSSICSVLPANALPAAAGGDKEAEMDGSSVPPAAAAAGVGAADASAATAPDAAPSSSSGGPPPASSLPCPWLGNLHCLVLRSCCLNKLPEAALASLTAVTSLDLSNNYLELLPPGLGSLKQLQVLLLDNNNYMRRAHQLPWSGLTALTHLSLSSCASLMGRRLQLSQLVGLQRLGAADNGSAPLGASLAGCTSLKVLDVRGTRIGRSLSAALIHHLPALRRCLYGPRRGGKWVAAVRRAAVVSGLEMVRDHGWVGTYEAQEDQDFWGPRDWVDQEASSGSSEGEKEEEEEGGSGSGSGSEEGEEEEGSDGSDDSQTDPSTESAATHDRDDSAEWEGDDEEEEGGSGSWEEDEDEM